MEMFMLFLCLVVGCAMNTEAKQVKMEVLKGVALDFHQLDPSILNGIEEHEVIKRGCQCETSRFWTGTKWILECCKCGCECTCRHVRESGVVIYDCCPCDCQCEICYETHTAGYNAITSPGGPDAKFLCCACGACFPANAKVSDENGNIKTMDELQVGDRVQTVSSDGSLVLSEVKTFLMKSQAVTTTYKSITTIWNKTVLLSGSHPIYTRNLSTDQFNAVYADQVTIGNQILVQENYTLIPSTVVQVASLELQGAYVPLTMEGNIVVDGIVASCYASFDHNLAHFTMTPMQWYPEIIKWVLGVEDGAPAYVTTAKELGRWLLPDELLFN